MNTPSQEGEGTEAAASPSNTDSWSHYWDSGALTSLADAFQANYQGAVRQHWEALFASLRDGTALLDIGTGNGAVPMIANGVARQRGIRFDLHGMDRARIDPARTVTAERELLDGICFHSDAAAEQMPFPDARFSAVTAQYALEYSDFARTLVEVYRVLAAGGLGSFVIHHPDSTVLKVAREELRHGALIAEIALFDRAEDLVGVLLGAPDTQARKALTGDADAQAARHAFNAAAERMGARIRGSRHPELLQIALDYVVRACKLANGGPASAALSLLEQGRREVSASLARLSDLVRATGDGSRISDIAERARDAGLIVQAPRKLYDEQRRLLGYALRVDKE
ncbi:MAG: class I SAM-dependent methyltransferase [Gammaproteobacteria bacterium]|nr:class I SAM-dependent methyltransferase [Gammaproteobacteria bacterium]